MAQKTFTNLTDRKKDRTATTKKQHKHRGKHPDDERDRKLIPKLEKQ